MVHELKCRPLEDRSTHLGVDGQFFEVITDIPAFTMHKPVVLRLSNSQEIIVEDIKEINEGYADPHLRLKCRLYTIESNQFVPRARVDNNAKLFYDDYK